MRCPALVAILAAPAFWVAAVEAESLPLATDEFHEEVRTGAQISGVMVAGLQRQGLAPAAARLRAWVPADWAGATVCARVVSVDGLYEAANDYEVAEDWSGAYADMPYPTRHPDRLDGAGRDGIAVRVTRGVCDGPPGDATSALWNDGLTQPLSLLVNSFQADSVFAYVEGATTPIRCGPVAQDGRSAYDVTCPMDGIATRGRVAVELLRIVNAKAVPPTSVVVWLP